jgi:hypothetical protein
LSIFRKTDKDIELPVPELPEVGITCRGIEPFVPAGDPASPWAATCVNAFPANPPAPSLASG